MNSCKNCPESEEQGDLYAWAAWMSPVIRMVFYLVLASMENNFYLSLSEKDSDLKRSGKICTPATIILVQLCFLPRKRAVSSQSH